jgi:dTDP-4-amino-4,6-dideoxygalactose transaminase
MSAIPLVDLKAQYETIKREIDDAIQHVIGDTAFIKGKYTREFEDNFARALGARHCIGVGNGTDALFIALRVLGIGRGDEVITAANSFIATSETITMTGAKVVFVDIDPETYTMDTAKIEEKITPKTKAIIPVHLYGQPADMEPILEISRDRGLLIIEDAAQAHFAEYKGRMVGTLGDLACFSFYPGKNLGAYGDAGAIVTDNYEWATKIRRIADHGRAGKHDHLFEGMNSRMDGLQGAILNVKLKYLHLWTQKRREIAAAYNGRLKGIDGIVTPVEREYVKHVYHLYVIRSQSRESLIDYLRIKGISTGVHYPEALPNLQAYGYLGYKPSDFPVASQYQKEILSLPIYPELSENQIQHITDSIKMFL